MSGHDEDKKASTAEPSSTEQAPAAETREEGGAPGLGREEDVAATADGEAGLREQVERLGSELAARTAEAERSRDLYLRERAELENFKKRMQREKAEALRYASEALIRDLIPAIDNLERAVEHSEGGGNGHPLVEGVRLVWKSMIEILERHGVKRVEAVGEKFDPNRHEALARVADAGCEPNEVVEQFLPGYCLHERLLRPAQVSVAARPPVENAGDDD